MTVDRKRLRELALAAQKMIEEQPTVGRWVQHLWNEYVKAANPQTILELLDALEAAEQPALLPMDDGRRDELLAWAYGKLHRIEFAGIEDALALDEIKLLLTYGNVPERTKEQE